MKFSSFVIIPLLLVSAVAGAEERPTFEITIQNHVFTPSEITVPAGKRVKLVIINKDKIPEEFESYELNREKIITGNSKGTVYIGPLDPGRYPFFGEFHPKTAKGVIIAK